MILPTIALVPWGNTIEDFLRPNRLDLSSFCKSSGGWLFGYVEALQAANVGTVLFLFSEEVDEPTRLVHEQTGARMVAMPPPAPYRLLRRSMVDPYGRTAAQTFGSGGALRAVARELAPYLATPVRAFARELRREGCSAVLVQEHEFPRFDVLALTRPAGLPVFASFQGGDYRRWRLESLVRPRALRRAAGLIVPAEQEHARLLRSYSHLPPIARIFNPVDLERWRPGRSAGTRSALGIGEDERVAVWHGRVEITKKGLDVLFAAWPRVGVAARLVLIGTGPDADALQDLARPHGDSVVLVDRTDDPVRLRSLVAAGDVYVFPSRNEGFALAPVEAAACGLPVVAARAGGVEDAFPAGEGSGALLVEREDPGGLASSLDRLLGDSSAAAELGARARARAEAAFGLPSVGGRLGSFLGIGGSAA